MHRAVGQYLRMGGQNAHIEINQVVTGRRIGSRHNRRQLGKYAVDRVVGAIEVCQIYNSVSVGKSVERIRVAQALDDPAKHREAAAVVGIIQSSRVVVEVEEELRIGGIGVTAQLGHREGAVRVAVEFARDKFIRDVAEVGNDAEIAVGRRKKIRAQWIQRGETAALENKTRLAAMKKRVLIRAGLHQTDEVIHGGGLVLIEQFHIHIAEVIADPNIKVKCRQRPGQASRSKASPTQKNNQASRRFHET